MNTQAQVNFVTRVNHLKLSYVDDATQNISSVQSHCSSASLLLMLEIFAVRQMKELTLLKGNTAKAYLLIP